MDDLPYHQLITLFRSSAGWSATVSHGASIGLWRRLDDQAAAIDRGALSDAGAHPCFPGQRALSSRQARAGMVSPAGTTHQVALHPNLLPALEPDRAVMGRDAQTRHAQQVLRNLRSICRCDARFPARKSSPELGQPM